MDIKEKSRIHGAAAIVLFIGAFMSGGYVVFMDSVLFGSIYAAIIVMFFTAIPAVYCSKCPCRDRCMHVILGPISKLLVSKPNESGYTVTDVVLTLSVAAAAVIMPQPWLIKNIPFLIFYWIAVTIAAAEIFLFVCKGCGNEKCPMKKISGCK
ncbi:MAG: hypothetical protein JXR81_09445 [Candidatus Goldbacteria bacterium]|nr:hypothetical protein [Candidatus Goldiibacteriota bacterium]